MRPWMCTQPSVSLPCWILGRISFDKGFLLSAHFAAPCQIICKMSWDGQRRGVLHVKWKVSRTAYWSDFWGVALMCCPHRTPFPTRMTAVQVKIKFKIEDMVHRCRLIAVCNVWHFQIRHNAAGQSVSSRRMDVKYLKWVVSTQFAW